MRACECVCVHGVCVCVHAYVYAHACTCLKLSVPILSAYCVNLDCNQSRASCGLVGHGYSQVNCQDIIFECTKFLIAYLSKGPSGIRYSMLYTTK